MILKSSPFSFRGEDRHTDGCGVQPNFLPGERLIAVRKKISKNIIDPLARTGQCDHSILAGFPVYQQGALDCYCGIYATINLISFIRNYGPQPREPLGRIELKKILQRFGSLHESLGFLGGCGSEGYELLPVARRAFATADVKYARLSLREKSLDQSKQTKREKELPARIGIELPQDLEPESGRTLALAAVYECNKKPGTWEVSREDELGHWVAIVGKEYVPKTHSAALDGYNGIVLDSNRGYELWKLDGQSGLLLSRAADPSKTSREIRVWVYSLVTIKIGGSS